MDRGTGRFVRPRNDLGMRRVSRDGRIRARQEDVRFVVELRVGGQRGPYDQHAEPFLHSNWTLALQGRGFGDRRDCLLHAARPSGSANRLERSPADGRTQRTAARVPPPSGQPFVMGSAMLRHDGRPQRPGNVTITSMPAAKRDKGDPELAELFDRFEGHLVTPSGAAALLGISRHTVHTLCSRGQMRAIRGSGEKPRPPTCDGSTFRWRTYGPTPFAQAERLARWSSGISGSRARHEPVAQPYYNGSVYLAQGVDAFLHWRQMERAQRHGRSSHIERSSRSSSTVTPARHSPTSTARREQSFCGSSSSVGPTAAHRRAATSSRSSTPSSHGQSPRN